MSPHSNPIITRQPINLGPHPAMSTHPLTYARVALLCYTKDYHNQPLTKVQKTTNLTTSKDGGWVDQFFGYRQVYEGYLWGCGVSVWVQIAHHLAYNFKQHEHLSEARHVLII